ncbi:hypothetical protein N7540_010024 [Penicillium herquei]|nr:hypothetical protein N7540_010024 [Penicillium herquei]
MKTSKQSLATSNTFLDIQLTRSQGLGTPSINVALVINGGMDFREKEVISDSKGHEWQFGVGAYVASEHQKPPVKKIRVHTDMGILEEFEQNIAEGDFSNERDSDARSSNKAKRWSSGEDPYESDHARRQIPHITLSREVNPNRDSSDHARPQIPRRPIPNNVNEGSSDEDSPHHRRPHIPRRPIPHMANQENSNGYSSDDARPPLPRRPIHHTSPSHGQNSDEYSHGDSGQEAYEQDLTTDGSDSEEATTSQGGYISDDSESEEGRPATGSAGRVKRSWKSALTRFSSSKHQK